MTYLGAVVRAAFLASIGCAACAGCAFRPESGVFQGTPPRIASLSVAADGAAIAAMTDAVRVLGPDGRVIELPPLKEAKQRTPRWAGESADRSSIAVVYDDAVIVFRGSREGGSDRYEPSAVLDLPGRFRAAAINPRVNELAVATTAGMTRIPLPGMSPSVHTPLPDGAYALAFDGTGQRLAYAEAASVSVVDLTAKDGSRVEQKLDWTPDALAFDDRDGLLGVAGRRLVVWSLTDASLVAVKGVSDVRALAHVATLGSFALCSAEGVKLCGGVDHCVDVARPGPAAEPPEDGACRFLAAAPDGTALAAAGTMPSIDRVTALRDGQDWTAPLTLRRGVVDGVIDVAEAK